LKEVQVSVLRFGLKSKRIRKFEAQIVENRARQYEPPVRTPPALPQFNKTLARSSVAPRSTFGRQAPLFTAPMLHAAGLRSRGAIAFDHPPDGPTVPEDQHRAAIVLVEIAVAIAIYQF
jgi:hypothetical protein